MLSTMAGVTIASLLMTSAVAQAARSASHDGAVAPYAIRQQYALGGPGGWDYLTSHSHRSSPKDLPSFKVLVVGN